MLAAMKDLFLKSLFISPGHDLISEPLTTRKLKLQHHSKNQTTRKYAFVNTYVGIVYVCASQPF
jgi:hypothetical protein